VPTLVEKVDQNTSERFIYLTDQQGKVRRLKN